MCFKQANFKGFISGLSCSSQRSSSYECITRHSRIRGDRNQEEEEEEEET